MSELGIVRSEPLSFQECLALQRKAHRARRKNRIPDTILVIDHDEVTLEVGPQTQPDDFKEKKSWYKKQGWKTVDAERAGGITVHAPGQLICAAICKLSPEYDAREHVIWLEESVIAALRDWGIAGQTMGRGPLTGVWVRGRKIAQVGCAIRSGVTSHGISVNVTNDLAPFKSVSACGIEDLEVTSVALELNREPEGDFTQSVLDYLASFRSLSLTDLNLDDLE